MPIIKSSSELQRNFSAINELARKTGEPIYITRNGESSLVVMDVEAFEQALDLQERIKEHEMAIREAIMQSQRDFEEGRGMSLDEVRRLRAERRLEREVA